MSHGLITERRLNMRLMGYWQGLRGSDSCALAERFAIDDISDLWPYCFMMDATMQAEDALLSHIGSRIAAESGVATESLPVREIPPDTLLRQPLTLVSEVLHARHPVVDSREFTDNQGRLCRYRGILMPLSNARGNIEVMVGGARCRVLEDPDPGGR